MVSGRELLRNKCPGEVARVDLSYCFHAVADAGMRGSWGYGDFPVSESGAGGTVTWCLVGSRHGGGKCEPSV